MDKLIENFVFGRSRLKSRVFEKLFILHSCILFIKYCVLKSFCIKMLCFSKIWNFHIFNRSNLLLDWSKLRLKIWFESTWLDRCSIDAGSIKCNFRSIEPVFRSIENRSESFFKQEFFTCSSLCKTFQKALSLSSIDPDSKQDYYTLPFSVSFHFSCI